MDSIMAGNVADARAVHYCTPSALPTHSVRRDAMSRMPRPAGSAILIALVALHAPAQQNRTSAQPVTQAGAASAKDPGKRPLTIAEYARWRSIRDVAISDDGVWASYGYQQRKTDDTLFVKNLATGVEQKIARPSRAQFSDDAKWVAYFVSLPVKEAERLRAARTPTPERVELRNLASGQIVGWENAASFAFARGSGHFMVRKARSAGAGDAAPATGGGGGGGRGGRGGGA